MEFPQGAMIVQWCSGCNAEQAIDVIDVQIGDEWVQLDIGPGCLTRLKDAGRIEL